MVQLYGIPSPGIQCVPGLKRSQLLNKGDNGNTKDHGKMRKRCGNYYNFS